MPKKTATRKADAQSEPSYRIRHPKKRAFIAAYEQTACISIAADAAKIHRSTHYDWLAKDKDYKAAFADAEAVTIDLLEAEARRRAYNGVNEPVVYQGRLAGQWVDEDGNPVPDVTIDEEDGRVIAAPPPGSKFIPLTVKKYSDTLMIFLLKGANPDKYRENRDIRLRGDAENPIPLVIKDPRKQ